MKIDIKPGTYVVAVSGGVDSIVLLDVLAKLAQSSELRAKSFKKEKIPSSQLSAHSFQLVVAHFDHGMRPDSEKDRLFVGRQAEKYGLPFVYDEGRLGPKASEATARTARYKFLEKTKKAAEAHAIITAHHQDDMLETVIINLLRGTGRHGLTALKSDKILRPLLDVSKKDILTYARKHRLKWHEDPTNVDTDYLRNYVRHKLLPKFDQESRAKLLEIISKLKTTNQNLDNIVNDLLKAQPAKTLDRHLLTMFSHDAARELMASWLRQNKIRDFDQKTIERLVRAAKTYQAGKEADVNGKRSMKVSKDVLALVN